jgi:hypothetical protein
MPHGATVSQAKLYEEVAEATADGDAIEEEIKQAASQVSAGEPLRRFVNLILQQSVLGGSDAENGAGGVVSQDAGDDIVTANTLTKLHKRQIKSRSVHVFRYLLLPTFQTRHRSCRGADFPAHFSAWGLVL